LDPPSFPTRRSSDLKRPHDNSCDYSSDCLVRPKDWPAIGEASATIKRRTSPKYERRSVGKVGGTNEQQSRSNESRHLPEGPSELAMVNNSSPRRLRYRLRRS